MKRKTMTKNVERLFEEEEEEEDTNDNIKKTFHTHHSKPEK